MGSSWTEKTFYCIRIAFIIVTAYYYYWPIFRSNQPNDVVFEPQWIAKKYLRLSICCTRNRTKRIDFIYETNFNTLIQLEWICRRIANKIVIKNCQLPKFLIRRCVGTACLVPTLSIRCHFNFLLEFIFILLSRRSNGCLMIPQNSIDPACRR